jgi:hypothetical protein
LKWIADVAAFLRFHRELEWHAVVTQARSSGGERQLLVGLCLASDILNADVPVPLRESISRNARVSALAREFAGSLFATWPPHRRTHQGPYGHVRGGLLYIRTRERVRDRIPYSLDLIGYLFGWLKHAVTPNVHDRAFVRLPRVLDFLYYFLRPVRVTRDLARRVASLWPASRLRRQP